MVNFTLTTLASFDGSNGANPYAGLLADAAGNLYGTTYGGGTDGYGTVFELAAGSHTPITLASFDGGNGAGPYAGLLADAAGNLYGTTYGGGTGNAGTVFELAVGSHTLITLASFDYSNGTNPYAGLLADAAGNLYGTTLSGGPDGYGTVFELTAGSHTLTTLVSFDVNNGAYPYGGLLADAAGNLYGTTGYGGTGGAGTVFELAAGSHTLTTLASFDGSNGGIPAAGLLADAAGNLYGTTYYGGTGNAGTVFELAVGSHTLTTLASFGGSNGTNPYGGLLADAAGNLYGTTMGGQAIVGGTVFELAAGSHTLTTLASFDGSTGAVPYGGLVADAAGNLYGTTVGGGTNGSGTVFELSGTGFVVQANAAPTAVADAATATEDGGTITIDVLRNDTDADAGDTRTLVSLDTAGLTGTASIVNGAVAYDPGSQFQSLAAGQTATTSLAYTMADAAGAQSSATLTITVAGSNDAPTAIALSNAAIGQFAGAHAVVGTLSSTDVDSTGFTYSLVPGIGGTDNAAFGITGAGLFAVDAAALPGGSYSIRVQTDDGAGGTFQQVLAVQVTADIAPPVFAPITLTTLINFDGGNGGGPYAGLIADAAGNLYGTTYGGGQGDYGTVFELAAGSHALTTLASFDGSNGGGPRAWLLADAAGNLYGTTVYGGMSNIGTVFELAAGSHTLTTLASFNGGNGANPCAGLVADAAGNLYGTTLSGGTSDRGTVFEITAGNHTLATLLNFDGYNGANPYAGLLADAAGNLYGTTIYGGPGDYGTVFELAAGSHTLTTLASFDGSNGHLPAAGLLADAAGNLYGTTYAGGTGNFGTVFELVAGSHTLTTLMTFNGYNGANPLAGLLADATGNLYGTTVYGGANNAGTVFALAAGSHTLTTLASFDGSNGTAPYARLVADAAGNLYGTTIDGGTVHSGTIFELSGTGFVVQANAAPTAPLITAISTDTDIPDDGVTSDHALVVSGTAAAGSTVRVFLDGTPFDTTTADGLGAWHTAELAVADGSHALTADATSAAGLTSALGAAFDLLVFPGSLHLDAGPNWGASFAGTPGNDSVSAAGSGNTLDGLGGNDSLSATEWGNHLDGGTGDDVLDGGQGNSTILGGAGDNSIHVLGWNDIITAGDGRNTVTGPQGSATVTLGDGGNTVVLAGYDNSIVTGAGNDDLTPGDGHGSASAGGGDDRIRLGHGGGFQVDGGAGSDTVYYDLAGPGVTVTHNVDGSISLGGPNGTDTLVGIEFVQFNGMLLDLDAAPALPPPTAPATSGDANGGSTLVGTAGNDTLTGFGSGNIIDALDGNDVIHGGSGNAIIIASDGDKTIDLGGWDNAVTAGNGDSTLVGSQGGTQVRFGDGAASITLDGYGNSVGIGDTPIGKTSTIHAGDGGASIGMGDGAVDIVVGGYVNDISGGNGRHSLSGPAGNTTVTFGDGDLAARLGGGGNSLHLGAGTHVFDTGYGQATVNALGSNVITARGYGNTITTGDGDDSVTGTEGFANLHLGNGSNTVEAGGWYNTIVTGTGADHVTLTGGGATVMTGAGNDTIILGGGGNIVVAGGGNDSITGSAGSDLFIFNAPGQGIDRITGFDAAQGDVLQIDGGGFDDVTLSGSGDIDVLVHGVQIAVLVGVGTLDLAALLGSHAILI